MKRIQWWTKAAKLASDALFPTRGDPIVLENTAWHGFEKSGLMGKTPGRGRCGMVGPLRSPEKLKFTQEDGRELTDAVHHLFDFLHRYTAPISPLQKRDLKRATALSDGTAVYSEGRIKVPELCEIEEKFFGILAKSLDGKRE